MKKVLIMGAGGHGQVVADILLSIGEEQHDVSVIGFVDDDPVLWEKKFLSLPVLGPIESFTGFCPDAVVVAIGDNRARARLAAYVSERGTALMSAVHPRAIIGTGVKIGPGSMVCAGVVVNTGTTVGEGVILNTGCTVDHHGVIGIFCHIAPGSRLGGEVVVGEGSLIGIGASVLPHIRIGARAVVGAGAVVTQDIPDGCTVVGVPARRLVRHEA